MLPWQYFKPFQMNYLIVLRIVSNELSDGIAMASLLSLILLRVVAKELIALQIVLINTQLSLRMCGINCLIICIV